MCRAAGGVPVPLPVGEPSLHFHPAGHAPAPTGGPGGRRCLRLDCRTRPTSGPGFPGDLSSGHAAGRARGGGAADAAVCTADGCAGECAQHPPAPQLRCAPCLSRSSCPACSTSPFLLTSSLASCPNSLSFFCCFCAQCRKPGCSGGGPRAAQPQDCSHPGTGGRPQGRQRLAAAGGGGGPGVYRCCVALCCAVYAVLHCAVLCRTTMCSALHCTVLCCGAR